LTLAIAVFPKVLGNFSRPDVRRGQETPGA
jgi:hypothetical protein